MLLQEQSPPWSEEADADQMDSLNQMEVSLKEDMQAEASMIHALQKKHSQKAQAEEVAAELGIDDESLKKKAKKLAAAKKVAAAKKAAAAKKEAWKDEREREEEAKKAKKAKKVAKKVAHHEAPRRDPTAEPRRSHKMSNPTAVHNKHVLWAIDHKTNEVYFTSSTNPFPESPFFSNSDSLKTWKKESAAQTR